MPYLSKEEIAAQLTGQLTAEQLATLAAVIAEHLRSPFAFMAAKDIAAVTGHDTRQAAALAQALWAAGWLNAYGIISADDADTQWTAYALPRIVADHAGFLAAAIRAQLSGKPEAGR